MSYDCEHCLNCTENAIGESIAYCEVWDDWRNITQGFCFGNCDMQYREGEKIVNKPMTNGDRIRAMTDEELSQFLGTMSACGFDCPAQEYCMKSTETSCVVNMLEWLQQPVKEDAG